MPCTPVPGQVTVFASGPLTNRAMAQRIDPTFARTAKELVVMGGLIWRKITDTPVDISLQSWYSDPMQAAIAKSDSPVAQYLVTYDTERYTMWDEIAALAWLQPHLVTKTRTLYLDADMSHGPSHRNTLAWTRQRKPHTPGRP